MNTGRKLIVGLSISLLALAALTSVAVAAPPTNDKLTSATPVRLGFTQTLDTTQATTDGDDAQLNASCGAPVTEASVWYRLQGTGAGVMIDVSKSSYPAAVLVAVGNPGNLQTVTCGPDSVIFYAAAGTTYYALAIDDQSDGGGNGGKLIISFSATTPPPTVSVTVNPNGRVDTRTGAATISGTYRCSNSSFIDLFVETQQTTSGATVKGFGSLTDYGTCNGAPHNWSAEVFPQNGKFRIGKATAVTLTLTCRAVPCAEGDAEHPVNLRAVKK